MKIEITDKGVVYCDGNVCDPIGLYATDDECGNCQLLKICRDYTEEYYDVGC